MNQDEKSVQSQEADGSTCRQTCSRGAQPEGTPPPAAWPGAAEAPHRRRPGPAAPSSGPARRSLLTDVTGAGEEVDHEAGLRQVRQDGVMHDHQHLLADAERQLPEAAVRSVRPAPPAGAQPRGPSPTPTWCLRKPSHICWKAFLCSCGEAAGWACPRSQSCPLSSCLRYGARA